MDVLNIVKGLISEQLGADEDSMVWKLLSRTWMQTR